MKKTLLLIFATVLITSCIEKLPFDNIYDPGELVEDNGEYKEESMSMLLINAAKMILAGLNIKDACNIGIIQPLTDDIDIQISLQDILMLHI